MKTPRDYIGKDDDVDRVKFNLCSGLGTPASLGSECHTPRIRIIRHEVKCRSFEVRFAVGQESKFFC